MWCPGSAIRLPSAVAGPSAISKCSPPAFAHCGPAATLSLRCGTASSRDSLVPPDPARWTLWLLRVVRSRASEAELGDIQEEFASGNRSAFWMVRQIVSAIRKPALRVTFNEGRTRLLSNFWSDLRYT